MKKFRLAFLSTSTALLGVACASIIDLPSSVTIGATEDDAGTLAPDAATAPLDLCPTPIRLRGLNALRSVDVADVALPLFLGSIDLLREINESGGVMGCKLEWQYAEAVYGDPSDAVRVYEQWKAAPEWNEVVGLTGQGSADAIALGPKAADDKRVFVSVGYNGTLAAPKPVNVSVDVPQVNADFTAQTVTNGIQTSGYPYTFFPGTDYSTGVRIALDKVKSLDPGARVAFVHCDDNEFCTNPLFAGRSYVLQTGDLKLGRDLIASLTDLSPEYGAKVLAYFVAEATRKAADPTYQPVSWLWSGNLNLGTFFLAATLGSLTLTAAPPPASGLTQPQWDATRALIAGTKIIANNYGFDESLPARCYAGLAKNPAFGAGAAAVQESACNRIYGIMPYLAYGDLSTSSPEMPKVVALHDKWRQRDPDGGTASYFDADVLPALAARGGIPPTQTVRYVQGYTMVLLLRRAMEAVLSSGRRVTGETLHEALEAFRSQDTGGLTNPLTFTADDHRPQSAVAVYRVAVPADGGRGNISLVDANRRLNLQPQWLGW